MSAIRSLGELIAIAVFLSGLGLVILAFGG